MYVHIYILFIYLFIYLSCDKFTSWAHNTILNNKKYNKTNTNNLTRPKTY